MGNGLPENCNNERLLGRTAYTQISAPDQHLTEPSRTSSPGAGEPGERLNLLLLTTPSHSSHTHHIFGKLIILSSQDWLPHGPDEMAEQNPSSAWGTSATFELVDQDSESDGQHEQDITHFPVRRRKDVPSSPTIFTNTTRLDGGQQPTATARNGSSIGRFASKNQPDSGRNTTSVVRTSSPIDISAVEEENQAEFKDTPWTIARRLARKNKRKASISRPPRFGTQFGIKLPPGPPEQRPEPAMRNTHQSASGCHQLIKPGGPFDQNLVRDRSSAQPCLAESLDKSGSYQDPLDCPSPYQDELIEANHHKTYIHDALKSGIRPASDHPMSPHGSLPQSSSPTIYNNHQRGARSHPRVQHRSGQAQFFPEIRHILGQYSEANHSPGGPLDQEELDTPAQPSPSWHPSQQFERAPLPLSSSENYGTEYGIENTTSVIERFPGFSTSIAEEDDQYADDTFDSYYRETGLEDEGGYQPEIYDDDDNQVRYDDQSYGGPGSNHLVESQAPDNDGYDYEPMDYYPEEAMQESGRASEYEEAWDEGQPAFDLQVGSRGYMQQYSEGGSTATEFQTESMPVGPWAQDQRRAVRRRPSSKVGRLSRYTKRSPYRAPPYARGSSSNRTPAEVFHYKASGHRPKQAFHDAISSFKFNTPRPRPHPPPRREPHSSPLKPLKLSCLYEPAGASLDDKQDETGRCDDDDDVQLRAPAIRSRAIKPASLKTSTSSKRTPRSATGSRLDPEPVPRPGSCMDKRALEHESEELMRNKRGDPRRGSRLRSESNTPVGQKPLPKPGLPLPMRRGPGPGRSARAEPEPSSTEEESSGSESIEVIEPPRQEGASGAIPRRKTDALLSDPRASSLRRTELGQKPENNYASPHPSPTLIPTRSPKTVFFKFDLHSLSVNRCRVLRHVLEEQVSATKIWEEA
ncbi:hypothetical protein PGT21_018951 [Puccinia graminis f. sp. tritici]|uniref:Uncharacterized protein n=1 Tax=Puccinia graminis f. sp. tritici TaxID=56615 RepID=A0A5B0LKW4_PUCGR|nr:hypothetical protein PGT21_018951 [Puccinia graminis f. sp. tritici]